MAILLAACRGAKPAEVQPTRAPATITLTTPPNPAQLGAVELRFAAVDEHGRPLTGADFAVIADHWDIAEMTMHAKASDILDL